MKKLLVLFGALLLLPQVMFAADFRTESVGANENVTNLYIGGQSVVVNANVKSDLVAGGGDVQVNGSVQNDLIAAGGTVRIKGNVGTNARVAGGNVYLDGTVGQDVNVFGGNVNLTNSSVVNGDLIVFGGTVNIDGQVKGNVYLSGGMVTVRGNVSGNVTAKNVGTLRVVNGATIGGKLNYSSQNEATIENGAKVGSVNFTKLTPNNNYSRNFGSFIAGMLLLKAVIGFITLLVLVYLFPKLSTAVTENGYNRFWINLLTGFVTFIVVPVVLLILLITILGSMIAVIAWVLYLLLLMLAALYSTLLIGVGVWKLLARDEGYVVDWKTVLLGTFIVLVLSFIPILGWIVLAFFFLVALGSLLTGGWDQTRLQFAKK